MSCIKNMAALVFNIKHTRMIVFKSTLFAKFLLRPMLPSVGGFAISFDGYFFRIGMPPCHFQIF